MGGVGSSLVTSEVGGKFSAKDVNSVLLKAGALVALKPGEALITQGEPEPSLFFVLHGEVSITLTTPEGKTKEIGRRGRHEVVGEMGFRCEGTVRGIDELAHAVNQVARRHVACH